LDVDCSFFPLFLFFTALLFEGFDGFAATALSDLGGVRTCPEDSEVVALPFVTSTPDPLTTYLLELSVKTPHALKAGRKAIKSEPPTEK